MKFYENIEAERDRIETSIKISVILPTTILTGGFAALLTPIVYRFLFSGLMEVVFWLIVQKMNGGSGLTRFLGKEMTEVIGEFAAEVFKDEDIEVLWCGDVSDKIYPELKRTEP